MLPVMLPGGSPGRSPVARARCGTPAPRRLRACPAGAPNRSTCSTLLVRSNAVAFAAPVAVPLGAPARTMRSRSFCRPSSRAGIGPDQRHLDRGAPAGTPVTRLELLRPAPERGSTSSLTHHAAERPGRPSVSKSTRPKPWSGVGDRARLARARTGRRGMRAPLISIALIRAALGFAIARSCAPGTRAGPSRATGYQRASPCWCRCRTCSPAAGRRPKTVFSWTRHGTASTGSRSPGRRRRA